MCVEPAEERWEADIAHRRSPSWNCTEMETGPMIERDGQFFRVITASGSINARAPTVKPEIKDAMLMPKGAYAPKTRRRFSEDHKAKLRDAAHLRSERSEYRQHLSDMANRRWHALTGDP